MHLVPILSELRLLTHNYGCLHMHEAIHYHFFVTLAEGEQNIISFVMDCLEEIKRNQSEIMENLMGKLSAIQVPASTNEVPFTTPVFPSQSEPEEAAAQTVGSILPGSVPPHQPVQLLGLESSTPPPVPHHYPPKPRYQPQMHQVPHYQPVSLQIHADRGILVFVLVHTWLTTQRCLAGSFKLIQFGSFRT